MRLAGTGSPIALADLTEVQLIVIACIFWVVLGQGEKSIRENRDRGGY